MYVPRGDSECRANCVGGRDLVCGWKACFIDDGRGGGACLALPLRDVKDKYILRNATVLRRAHYYNRSGQYTHRNKTVGVYVLSTHEIS